MNVRAWLLGVGLWVASASHFAGATEPAPADSLPPAIPSPALSPPAPQGQPGQVQPERLPAAGNAAVPSPPPGVPGGTYHLTLDDAKQRALATSKLLGLAAGNVQ